MTDDELLKLWDMGQQLTICLKAWEHIEALEQQLCNQADYVKILREALGGLQ